MITRIKICGVRRVEDAVLAADLGAAAIGMVFVPGTPREITVDRAASIAAALPAHVERVGVFVDADAESIRETALAARLTRIQLHGRESPDLARDLPGALTRTLHWDELDTNADRQAWTEARPDVDFLVDLPKSTPRPSAEQLWARAAPLASRLPLILAGSLTPDNVGRALRICRPTAVDVASGVEQSPGEKDPGRLRAFFDAVATADAVRGDHP